jgi:hypothetical protein
MALLGRRPGFFAKRNADSEPFLSYLPYIVDELIEVGTLTQEPETAEEKQAIFAMLSKLKNFKVHGPLVKLMRWMSFNNSENWYSGEVWFTKMAMTLVWIPMDSYGFLWIPMDSCGVLWIPMESYGFLWIPIDSYGFLWIPVDSYGFSIAKRCAVTHQSLRIAETKPVVCVLAFN